MPGRARRGRARRGGRRRPRRARCGSRRRRRRRGRAGDGLRRDALARPRALRRRAGARARRRRRRARPRLVPRPGAAGGRVARRGRGRARGVASSTPRSASRSAARSAPTRRSSTSWWRSCGGSRTPARSCTTRAGRRADKPDELPLAASAFRLVAGEALDHAARDADLRPRRHRRDLGARRAAVLPPRAARAAAARRDRRRRRPRRRRAVRAGARRRGRPRGLMLVWTHDRWRFPLPGAPPLPARQVPAAARARVADGLARADEVHEAEPVPWDAARRGARRRAARAASAPATLTRARAARAGAAVVAGARRARAALGRRHARRGAPRARARGVGDEPRRRHAPRRPRLRARLLPVQRRRASRWPRCVARASRGARWSSTATSTRATAPRRSARPPTRDAFTLSLHGARNYPFQRIPSDLDVDLASGTGDDALPRGAARGARLRAPRAERRRRVLPRRRRPVGGRPARPARAHQGRACARATSSCSTGCSRPAPRVCVVLAGGYADDVRDTVDINAATAAAVAQRLGATL